MDEKLEVRRDDEPVTALPGAVDRVPAKITDYYRWAFEQAALIRAGRFADIDVENVADEIEDVGKSDFRAFTSNLEIVLIHMLKWDHQPAKRCKSWDDSIFEHRLRIVELLRDSPSMAARQDQAVDRAYVLARRVASRQTKLALTRFAERCPYSWSAIMDSSYELTSED